MKPEEIKVDHSYRCVDGTIAKVLSIATRDNFQIVHLSLLSVKRVSQRRVKWPHYRIKDFAALCVEEVRETAAAEKGGAH